MAPKTPLDPARLQPPRRPTADLKDPVLRRHAHAIPHVGINAYLVALAAWQRGLKVTFHYELATRTERFARLAVQGFRGELFSVSDGRSTHYFRRTLGDLTTREHSAVAEDKQATKQRLTEHGIDVPDGIVVSRDQSAAIGPFLARHPGKRFILKPLNGTLGEGVVRNLDADQVLAAVQNHPGKVLMLEEQVPGVEYRVWVTGDRYISAYERRPVSVQGDGQQTLRQLAEAKTRERQRQCHPAVAKPVPLGEYEIAFLQRQGLGPEHVPAAGEQVFLNDDPSPHHSADHIEATDTLPEAVRETAIRTAQALHLPNTGLDFIVNPDTGRHVVLEANQCPILRGSAFPNQPTRVGNRVADSIIDHYFPESIDHPRHTRASFDFMAICQTLQGGMVADIALPVLGPDWQHQRFQIPATRTDDKTLPTIRQAMFTLGIHAQVIKTETGDLIVDVVAPKARYKAFTRMLTAAKATAQTPPV